MFDLPLSVRPNNLGSMLGVARTELALTKYLIGELLQSRSARHRSLQGFVPEAEQADWDMITAGQRVQVIKRDPSTGKGVLQFGTELIVGGEGTIAGLLGASPGDRKSTRLNSSHANISYAVFCLKKKKKKEKYTLLYRTT